MPIGAYISIITLNVNRLNAPTKRYRVMNGSKNKTHIYMLYKRITSDLETHTESKRMEKISHANGKQNKARVVILILDKIDFKIKNIIRDKEGHYTMINPRRRHNNCKHLCT